MKKPSVKQAMKKPMVKAKKAPKIDVVKPKKPKKIKPSVMPIDEWMDNRNKKEGY